MSAGPGHDARLVPLAACVWGAAAVGLGASDRGLATMVGAAGICTGWALWRCLRPRPTKARHALPRIATPAGALVASVGVIAVLSSLLVQGQIRRAGLEAAAPGSGTVQVELRLEDRSAPVRAPSPGREARVTATVLAITARGETSTTRAPALVLGPEDWLDLAPGTTGITQAVLIPAPRQERPAVVVILTAPIDARSPPAWWYRATHALHGGLAEVSDPLPPHARGLLPGIGVGDDTRVPARLAEAMRTVSLGHLLAVSGAHVAIVLGAVLGPLGSARPVIRATIGAAVLLGLVMLVGPEPSVVRAGAMGAVGLVAIIVGRRAVALPALAAAVTAVIVIDPWLAREAGLALSVSATAGLVVWSARWAEDLNERTGLPAPVCSALAIPGAAQVACTPVLLLLQPGLATYGVLANALVAPVIPPVTVLTLLATFVAPAWPSGALGLLSIAQWGTWWIERVAVTLAALPAATLPWPGGAGGAASVAVLAAIGVLATRGGSLGERARRAIRTATLPVVALAASLAMGSLVAMALAPSATLTVTGRLWGDALPAGWPLVQCDVGQGSALIVRATPSSALVIDVGPPGEAAADCLDAAGVSAIELLVLTHADSDHAGGLGPVLDRFPVARALVPATGEQRMAEVTGRLREREVDVAEVTADSPLASGAIGAATYRVLWPTPRAVELGAASGEDRSNELSLSLWIETEGITALVHGDVGAAEQAVLARSWPGGLPRTPDVLVVAHHGSADQDPATLAAHSGRVALISVGADNDYGHPAPGTLARLAAAGAYIARTDRCGPISIGAADDGDLLLAGCPP